MTQQEAYRQLQKRVYEIIYPDGIPLEFGCEVIIDFNVIMNITIEDAPCIYIRKGIAVKEPTLLTFEGSIIEQFPDKNLGKPLSLQDVMRVIVLKKDEAIIVTNYKYIRFCKDQNVITELDLSKEIKDQDQEVLGELYQLIK